LVYEPIGAPEIVAGLEAKILHRKAFGNREEGNPDFLRYFYKLLVALLPESADKLNQFLEGKKASGGFVLSCTGIYTLGTGPSDTVIFSVAIQPYKLTPRKNEQS
jgi:hypothetical protein